MRLRAQCEIFVWLWRQNHYGNHSGSYWTQLLISALFNTDESKRRRRPINPVASPRTRMEKEEAWFSLSLLPPSEFFLFFLPAFSRQKWITQTRESSMRWTLLCTTRKCQGILLQICTVRESLSISFGMLTGSRAGHRDCRHVKRLVCVLQRVQIGRGPIQCSMKWVLGRRRGVCVPGSKAGGTWSSTSTST